MVLVLEAGEVEAYRPILNQGFGGLLGAGSREGPMAAHANLVQGQQRGDNSV